jgi:hypothetical protein
MKTGTPYHPKTAALAARLDIPLYAAVGILEMLWHWSSQYASTGEVSKWGGESIAQHVQWGRPAEELIEGLVETGWLDRDEKGRLLLHHWADHCEDIVHRRLARQGQRFADGTTPNLKRLSGQERKEAMERYGVPLLKQQPKATENKPEEDRAHDVRTTCAQRAPCLSLSLNPDDLDPGRSSDIEKVAIVGEGGVRGGNECDDSAESSLPLFTNELPEQRDEPDPLMDWPTLQEFWPTLEAYIIEIHPKARLPSPGTKAYRDARRVLARLIRLDRYEVHEVIDCLTWLFVSPDEDATFWREQVQAVRALRIAKNGMTKFARIYEKWEKRNGRKGKYDWCEPEYRDGDPFKPAKQ